MRQRRKHLTVPALQNLLTTKVSKARNLCWTSGCLLVEDVPTPLPSIAVDAKTDDVFLCGGTSLQNPRRDGGSPVINGDRQATSELQSPHNELGRHHSSHNLNSGRVSFFVWRLQSDLSAAVSRVRWKPHQGPSLAIAWIPANRACVTSERSLEETSPTARSCFPPTWQFIQLRTTKLMAFVSPRIFQIPVSHHPAPACLVFWDGTQDKRAIIPMIW